MAGVIADNAKKKPEVLTAAIARPNAKPRWCAASPSRVRTAEWSNFRAITNHPREDLHALAEIHAGRIGRDRAGAGPAQSAEPVKIRIAWVAPVSNWASIVLEKKDLAKHLGKSYTLESIRFAGTPPMMTAIANGELEIANLAYSTFPLAVQNANLDDLRVIADEFQDGVAGYHTNEFAVLKDSPIKKVEDLKGKVIATNAAGSAVDIGRAPC